MLPYLTAQTFGNPSSAHRFGRSARAGLEQARREVAEAVGAAPNQVIFTSGGTEADNLGIVGAALASRDRGGAMCVVVSAIEHKAILAAAHAVCHLGGREVLLPVDGEGRVDLAALDAALADRPAVVSVMWVNNEVGVVQPVAEIAGALRRSRRAVPHRRRAGVRQVADEPGHRAMHPRHHLGPQDRRAEGHRRADRARPQGGRGHHPRWRPAVRHPAGHRERGRRGRAWAAPPSSPPPSRPRRRQRLGALRDALRDAPSRRHSRSGGERRGRRARPPCPQRGRAGRRQRGACSCTSTWPASPHRAGRPARPGRSSRPTCCVAMGVPHDLALGTIRFSLGHESTAADVDRVAEVMPDVVAKVRKLAGALGRA